MLYVSVRRRRLKKPPPLLSRDTGEIFFAGFALVPVALLVLAAFSDRFLLMLANSSRVTFAAAGMYSLFSILEDRTPSKQKRVRKPNA